MPQILLDEPVFSDISLMAGIQKRQSFPADKCSRLSDLSIANISNLFGTALRGRQDGKRPYPSGGGLYPIEAYFVGKLENTRLAHVYHYDPSMHALEELWAIPGNNTMKEIFPGAESVAPACVVLTGLWARNGAKYGDFGYYLGMIEAGHIGQNILLASTVFDLGARPMGGFDDATLVKALDLDERLEQVVYTIMLGRM